MANFEDFVVVDDDYLRRSHMSDAAIAAFRVAEDEARRAGSATIGALPLLSGLMADRNNLAAQTVLHSAETPERISAAARSLLHSQSAQNQQQVAPDAQLPVAEEVRHLCRLAVDEAKRLAPARSCGPEHLLLAMTRDDENSAAPLLKQAGFTLERTRRALRIVLGMPA